MSGLTSNPGSNYGLVEALSPVRIVAEPLVNITLQSTALALGSYFVATASALKPLSSKMAKRNGMRLITDWMSTLPGFPLIAIVQRRPEALTRIHDA